jgi:pyruvate,water dikinase
VVTKNYLNLHLGVGYHFNLIDSRMEQDPRHNHIYFRFVGGVTDLTRRSRRAQLIARILSSYHFKVETKGDLVVARINFLSEDETGEMLEVLGHLIGFTRQLDIQLKREEDVHYFLEAFFKRAPRP